MTRNADYLRKRKQAQYTLPSEKRKPICDDQIKQNSCL